MGCFISVYFWFEVDAVKRRDSVEFLASLDLDR